MAMVLHNAPQSTCSQRVRFVLNAKGLAFDEVKLDLFSGDQLKPDYLRLNPNGVVPTLVDDGAVIIDSAVIMEYLEDRYPAFGPTLRPGDPIGLAHLRSLLRYIDEVPTPAVRIPSYNLAFLPHYQAMTEEEFRAVADSKPLRREFLLKMGRTGFSREEMDSALDRLHRAIIRMEETIAAAGGPFLMGDALTLADIAVMPVIVRLDDIGLSSLWDGKPTIARWFERIGTHTAFAPTYYFGALLTEKYPHLREKFEKPKEPV